MSDKCESNITMQVTLKQVYRAGSIFVALLLVANIGFGSAYGYGNRAGVRKVVTQEVSPAGEVLGAAVQQYQFVADIRRGERSDNVRALQERLRRESFFTFHTSTGYFGSITESALRSYQEANGLPVTGVLNAATRAQLNSTQDPIVHVVVKEEEPDPFASLMARVAAILESISTGRDSGELSRKEADEATSQLGQIIKAFQQVF